MKKSLKNRVGYSLSRYQSKIAFGEAYWENTCCACAALLKETVSFLTLFFWATSHEIISFRFCTFRPLFSFVVSLLTWGYLCPLFVTSEAVRLLICVTQKNPPWEATSFAAGQKKNARILWSPEVHYLVHKSPPRFPIFSRMNPVHGLPPDFFKIQYKIVFHLLIGFQSCLISSGFLTKTLNFSSPIFVSRVWPISFSLN